MAVRILGTSPELTLIFDRSTFWLSSKQIRQLSQTLSEVDGVESVETTNVWYRKPKIRVVFDSHTETNGILRKMASALREANPPKSFDSVTGLPLSRTTESIDSSNVIDVQPAELRAARLSEAEARFSAGFPVARNRLREAAYGFLTVGSFAMSWVGLIVPGIPTVPFVLLTAHFALQASPKLRERLLKSRLFGPMIRDWQEYGAIHRVVQIEAYIFTIVIIFIGFLFSPPIPILYVGMAIASAMGLYAISKIPVIESSEQENLAAPSTRFLTNSAPVV